MIQEAWYQVKGWYKATRKRSPSPARVVLARLTTERVALYPRVPYQGENILVVM